MNAGLITDLPVAARLATFLHEISQRRFDLGSHDCGLMLADWCQAVCGFDPAADFRSRYRSVDDAIRIAGVASLPRLIGRQLRAHGVRLTQTPQYGDIAMIAISDRPARGAIVAHRYVLVGDAGLTSIPFASARRCAAWALHA